MRYLGDGGHEEDESEDWIQRHDERDCEIRHTSGVMQTGLVRTSAPERRHLLLAARMGHKLREEKAKEEGREDGLLGKGSNVTDNI